MRASQWPIVSLPQVARINPRNPDFTLQDSDEVTFLPMAAVEAETGRINLSEKRLWGSVRKGFTRFQENDVLLAKITPCMENGKACVARHLFGGAGSGSTEFHVLRPNTKLVEPEWLYLYLNQHLIRRDAMRHMRGAVGQQRVPASFYETLSIPLPDIETQREIVDWLQIKEDSLSRTQTHLEAITKRIKQARASILKAAVEGRLVPTEAELASIKNTSFLDAHNLIQKLEEERSHKSRKSKTKAYRSSKRSPVTPSPGCISSVPVGWATVTVDEICWDSGYGTSAKCSHNAFGDPVLRIPNIAKGRLDLADLKRTAHPGNIPDSDMVAPGDFLFVRTNGSMSILGKGCVIRTLPPIPMSYASYLIRLRLLGIDEIWRWFELTWSSSLTRKSIEASAVSSAGQNNISLSKVMSFQIPIPPLQEIHRILEAVDLRFSVLDQVESTVQASLARCALLRQAILKRAFEGRLVPPPPEPHGPADHAITEPIVG